jgi:hypothetical protein
MGRPHSQGHVCCMRFSMEEFYFQLHYYIEPFLSLQTGFSDNAQGNKICVSCGLISWC